ncbi:LysR family transcriptional regulator [Cognatishimia activa]|uniref:LysR family transcriptional regulator n=1 Tax=Cognatishimia activa TaxID=1715691 RepID=UPI0022311216|nr:LysR family transcriptional regulator [Cognatishimia activa]UZD89644.1 LysR family transcriptional regulator [Cognatishimia activa]
MQDITWNDLRYVLAMHRTGSYTEAGRKVGVSETTVARRVATLEEKLGVKLVQKGGNSGYEISDIGLLILDHIEVIEQQVSTILEIAGNKAATVGTVRLSAVPLVINRILVPELHRLHSKHPELVLELIPETRNIDLTKREADLAIRLARPVSGGLKTSARRIGQLNYAVFGQGSADSDKSDRSNWIIYDESQASFPQAVWLNAALAQGKDDSSPLRVADAETAIEAIAAGVGKSILPRRVAAMDQRLRELVRPAGTPPMPKRDVWLMSHNSQLGSAAVNAVKEWLADIPWN